MKLFSIIAILVLGLATKVSAQSVNNTQFWIPVDVKWTRIQGAPRDVKTRTAASVVLYFEKNGGFVRDECWLNRNGKSISISNGDPHNQYVGRITEPMLDGMRIKYRLVRRTVEKQGELLPGPEISETASTMATSGLAVGRRFFRPVEFANGKEYLASYSSLVQRYAHE